MKLGYVLLRDQLFFRRELEERVLWFVKLRWLAVAATFAGSWAATFLGLNLPIVQLSLISLFIFLYNLLFLFLSRRLEREKPQSVRPYSVFAHFQISLDLLALFFIVYFTGGFTSPVWAFTIFHIILAGILLEPVACYVYGAVVLAAAGGLILAQNANLLPVHPILFRDYVLFSQDQSLPTLLTMYLAFAAVILISIFLVTSVRRTLQIKGRELLQVSSELIASNEKLTALYDMVKEIGLKRDLKELMDSATRHAAKVMGVKGCSIKLLDENRRYLTFGSTYGLSADYLSIESIDIRKSPINNKIIEGSSPYVIGEIAEKDYFQYPEDIRKEGIASMLCLPLKIEKMVLGVLCVYSRESYHFSNNDVEFFSLLTELTALAMNNLKSELTKTWIMLRAAHQIRSPLNAIYSMIKLVHNEYLGPIEKKQKEILERCEKRIELLGDLLNDLLRLGEKRAEAIDKELHLVDVREALNNLLPVYYNQAMEKGLTLETDIEESLPKIMGDESLLDDIISNVVSNAIKYTPENGKIEIALCREGNAWLRLDIIDTGIGIPKQELKQLFTEFFRGESAKEMAEEGTGLGLAIVKEVLDQLGGKVHVQSEVGHGTYVTCRFPIPSS